MTPVVTSSGVAAPAPSASGAATTTAPASHPNDWAVLTGVSHGFTGAGSGADGVGAGAGAAGAAGHDANAGPSTLVAAAPMTPVVTSSGVAAPAANASGAATTTAIASPPNHWAADGAVTLPAFAVTVLDGWLRAPDAARWRLFKVRVGCWGCATRQACGMPASHCSTVRHVFVCTCAWQKIVSEGHVQELRLTQDGGTDFATAATLRLALHCLAWKGSLPKVVGELGWEERFVSAVVTGVFDHLLDERGTMRKGKAVVWKG